MMGQDNWNDLARAMRDRFRAMGESDLQRMGTREMKFALARAPRLADRVRYDPTSDKLYFYADNVELVVLAVQS